MQLNLDISKINEIVEAPCLDTHEILKSRNKNSVKQLLLLALEELVKVAWGPLASRYYSNQEGFSWNGKSWELSDCGLKADNELAAANLYIVTFTMARKGGIQLPTNVNGNTIELGSKVHYDLAILSEFSSKRAYVSPTANFKFTNLLEEFVEFFELEEVDSYDTFEFLRNNPAEDMLKKYQKQAIGKRAIKFASCRPAAWKVTQDAVVAARQAYQAGDTQTVFLADITFKTICTKWLNQKIGCVPSNLYFTDFDGQFVFGDHYVTKEELGHYFNVIAGACSYVDADDELQQFISSEEDADGNPVLWFENDYYLTSRRSDRITDAKGRFVKNSMSISDAHVQGKYGVASPHSIRYYSAGGTLLRFLLPLLGVIRSGDIYRAGYGARAMLAERLPMNSISDTGGTNTGDRGDYEQFVTVETLGGNAFPWIFDEYEEVALELCPGGNAAAYRSLVPYIRETAADPTIDPAALAKYDLVRIHKGVQAFTSGHFFHWSLRSLDPDTRLEFLNNYCLSFGSTLQEVIKKEYGFAAETREELDAFTSMLVLSRSTKHKKLTKRIALSQAVSAKQLSGLTRGEVREKYDYLYEAGSLNGLSEAAEFKVAYTHLITPPGQSYILPGAEYSHPFPRISTSNTDWARYRFTEAGDPMLNYILPDGELIRLEHCRWRYEYNSALNLASPVTGEADWVQTHGVLVKKGELLAKGEYYVRENVPGFNKLYAHEDLVVTAIEFHQKGNGNVKGALEVKIEGFVIETIAKLRSFLKTVPVLPSTGSELLYNELNKGVPAGVEVVSGKDADKSADNSKRRLSSAVQTLRQTEEGRNLLLATNQLFGRDDDDRLAYDARLGFMGAYDELYSTFEKAFGRSLWLYQRDTGQYFTMIRDMYALWGKTIAEHTRRLASEGVPADQLVKAAKDTFGMFWYELKGEERNKLAEFAAGKFPEHARIICDRMPEDLDDTFAHVLVFFEDEVDDYGCDFVFWQRSFSVVGKKGVHVKAPLRQELSSVSQVLSKSPVMDCVARVLATGIGAEDPRGLQPHPEAADAVMRDCTKGASLWSVFRAMQQKFPIVNRETGKSLPIINLFTEDGINPEILRLVKSEAPYLIELAQQDDLTLFHLAQVFSNVVIDCGYGDNAYYNLFIPAIYEKEGYKAVSSETMAGRTVAMFSNMLTDHQSEKAVERCLVQLGRNKASLDKLVASENARKMRGRMGVYGKVAASPAVPISKLWVRFAPKQGWYKMMSEILHDNGVDSNTMDGMSVFYSRMPMPFPGGLEVEVIYPGDPRYDLMNDYQPLMNPLVAYVDAGDWDGDDRCVVPMWDHRIQPITVEMVKFILSTRTGKDPLCIDASGDYIGDQCRLDKPGEIVTTLCGKKNLLSLMHPQVHHEKRLADILSAATKVQANFVGFTHQVAFCAEIANGIVSSVRDVLKQNDEDMQFEQFLTSSAAILVMLEIYENPLGGLDWSAKKWLEYLQFLFQDGGYNPLEGYDATHKLGLVSDAGLNASELHLQEEAATFAGECDTFHKGFLLNNAHPNCFVTFLKVTTSLTFLIGKGQFRPGLCEVILNSKKFSGINSCNSDLQMALYFFGFNPELRAQLASNSPAIKYLEEYLRETLIPSIYTADNALGARCVAELVGLDKVVKMRDGVEYRNARAYYTAPQELFIDDKAPKSANPKTADFTAAPEVENLVADLVDYLPSSRFGAAQGYKGWLSTEGKLLLSGCSEDQLAAARRFFFLEAKQFAPLYLLSGEGGTGKSFVTFLVYQILEKASEALPVRVGSTGVATQNIGGKMNFNSLFGQGTGNVLPAGLNDPTGSRKSSAGFVRALERNLGVSSNEGRFVVFMVDEVSMLSAHQLQVAMETARFHLNRGRFVEGEEFYYFSFFLVGDFPQLPPVYTDEDKANGKRVTPAYSNPRFFNEGEEYEFTSVFERYNCVRSGLWTNHRQGELAQLTDELNWVSEGGKLSSNSVFAPCFEREIAVEGSSIFMSNSAAQAVNRRAVEKLIAQGAKSIKTAGMVRLFGQWWRILSYNKDYAVIANEKQTLRGARIAKELSFLPKWAEPNMEIAVGQRFMFRQRDSKGSRWANGTCGIVTDVSSDHIVVNVNGENVRVEPELCEAVETGHDGRVIKEYYSFLGHAAHALTVSKTQGLTLSGQVNFAIDANEVKFAAQTPGLIYTALSRVTSVDNLSIVVTQDGERLSQEDAIATFNGAIAADPQAVAVRNQSKEELRTWVANRKALKVIPRKIEGDLFIAEATEETVVIKSRSKNLQFVFNVNTTHFDVFINGELRQSNISASQIEEKLEGCGEELSTLVKLRQAAVLSSISSDKYTAKSSDAYVLKDKADEEETEEQSSAPKSRFGVIG